MVNETNNSGAERPSRSYIPRFARSRRMAVVLVLALIAVIAAGLRWAADPAPYAKSEPTQQSAVRDGAFQATEAQLATFQIEEVGTRAFRSERVTEGKIAINQNRTTPGFSPSSGRVI